VLEPHDGVMGGRTCWPAGSALHCTAWQGCCTHVFCASVLLQAVYFRPVSGCLVPMVPVPGSAVCKHCACDVQVTCACMHCIVTTDVLDAHTCCATAGIGSGAGFAVAAARALMDVPGMTAFSIGGALQCSSTSTAVQQQVCARRHSKSRVVSTDAGIVVCLTLGTISALPVLDM
jgi:hypothetical protein